MSGARPLVTVRLEEAEWASRGGRRKVAHRVRHRDGWVAPVVLPGASCTREEPGPGTVYRRVWLVSLAPGTRVERVEESPAEPGRRDAAAWLLEPRRTRQVKRVELVVTDDGSLAPAARDRR